MVLCLEISLVGIYTLILFEKIIETMNRIYLRNFILSLLGLMIAFSAMSMNLITPDEEMPDNYVPVNVEEETSSNPHRSMSPCVYAYYYCKTVNFIMDIPVENLTIQVSNITNGRVKTEYVSYKEQSLCVDISGMGTGSYVIHMISKGCLMYSGSFDLY